MKYLVAIALFPLALMAFAPQPPDDATPHRMSFAERRELSKQTTTAITSQLLSKGCWIDHRDLPEARRLSVMLRIYLGPDGHLLGAPQLVQPATEPVGDRPLQEFIDLAREALKKCDAAGFDLPPGGADLLKDNYVDLLFWPRMDVTP